MSEQDDPAETRIRRMVADAGDDAPAPPSVREMMDLPRSKPDRVDARRKWVAGGAIGLVAAAVIALLVVPGNDDDAIEPADTPPTVEPTSPASPATTVTTVTTEPIATVPSTTTGSEPTTSVEATAPATTTTTASAATGPATVIAAVDDQGDAVLIPVGGDPLVVYDGPAPDAPAPEEGPGPTVVDSVALTPGGHTVFVGLCCEPIAGSILSGSPTGLSTDSATFGYAPAFSPDGRLLAVGQIQGPAVSLTDLSTGFDLEVPDFDEAFRSYSPYDNMWLDATRVVALGLASDDSGPRWVAIPIVVDGDEVAVGAALDVNEVLPAGAGGTPIEHPVVRLAGSTDVDRFAIHVPGETDATTIEFRMDGVIAADSAAGGNDAEGVGEAARSIWYQPDGPIVWVGENGVLRRGEETLAGTYQWARPTDATSVVVPEPPPDAGADASTAIDLGDATVFGFGYGTEADPDEVIADIEPALSDPTFDTGWQPTPTSFDPNFDECFGPRFRTVWWGDFRLTFGEFEDERVRVAAWSVGDPSVDTSAPLGDLPPTEASGVAADGVGVGSAREAVLDVVPRDGRIIGDTEEGVVVTGAIVTTFEIDDTDTVTAIGSGRLDCVTGPDL